MTYRATRILYTTLGLTTGVLLILLPGWWKFAAIAFYLAAFVGMPDGRYESKEREIR